MMITDEGVSKVYEISSSLLDDSKIVESIDELAKMNDGDFIVSTNRKTKLDVYQFRRDDTQFFPDTSIILFGPRYYVTANEWPIGDTKLIITPLLESCSVILTKSDVEHQNLYICPNHTSSGKMIRDMLGFYND